jgi:hypothetical protein
MTKRHSLQDRLARSLDQANQREKKATRKHAPAPAAPLPAERHCSKLSVSLFATDLERLEAIRSYMATRGHILSTSQTVKLAIRTAPLSAELDAALDQTRNEDGRKW